MEKFSKKIYNSLINRCLTYFNTRKVIQKEQPNAYYCIFANRI